LPENRKFFQSKPVLEKRARKKKIRQIIIAEILYLFFSINDQ